MTRELNDTVCDLGDIHLMLKAVNSWLDLAYF